MRDLFIPVHLEFTAHSRPKGNLTKQEKLTLRDKLESVGQTFQ